MATMPAAMSAIIIGTVNGLIRLGPRSISCVWLFSISSMPPMPELTITPTSSGSISEGSSPDCAIACFEAARANWQYRPMWRAVLRSMYSSGTKPLTSAAILVSKPVVSKWVMVFTPETPSIMFDHTVSTSLPIGVMKPMPVTATRRPLELEVMPTAYGPRGQCPSAWCGKTPLLSWTPCPSSLSEQLAELQGELQPQAGRRDLEVSPQDLAQLAKAVQDGVAVQLQRRGGVLDRPEDEIGLERFEELLAVAQLGFREPAQAVGDEALGEARVLGKHEVGDELVVTVRDPVRAQLAAGLERLLGLEVRTRNAAQPGVIAADARPHSCAGGAGALDGLLLKLSDELADRVDVRHRLRGPEHDQRAGVGCVVNRAARHVE